MNISLMIMEFLPLVIYIGIDAWKGFRAGIIAAMASTVAMSAYEYFIFGEIDKFVIGEGAMILVLGFVSLKMNNDRYFKFQPTVLAVIFSGVFAWFQVFDQPLILHFIPHMEKLLQSSNMDLHAFDHSAGLDQAAEEPGTLQMLHSPQFQKTLGRLSGHMIWLFLGHGAIMTYAALRLRTSSWFAWRLAIYPALFIVVMINQLFT